MTKKQLNVRASDEMRRNLDYLKEHFNESEGEVISRALALLYHSVWLRSMQPDKTWQYLLDQDAINEVEQANYWREGGSNED